MNPTPRRGNGTARRPITYGHGYPDPGFSGHHAPESPAGVLSIIDLCSGLGGFSEAFLSRGHHVRRMDIDPAFAHVPHTELGDVMDMPDISGYDVVLASPPCQAFSVASIGHHWAGGKRVYTPRTDVARSTIVLARHIFKLCRDSGAIYFIENPRGLLRKMPLAMPINGETRHTVTYCQYGERRMKPTDIWTNSKTWEPRPMCKNGDPCHEAAPRGSRMGTQGMIGAAERAKVPYELSMEICLSCEKEAGVRP